MDAHCGEFAGSIAATMRFLSIALLGLALPWFGVPLPAGFGDPHRPILDVSHRQAGAGDRAAGRRRPCRTDRRARSGNISKPSSASRAPIARAARRRGVGSPASAPPTRRTRGRCSSSRLPDCATPQTQTYTATQADLVPEVVGSEAARDAAKLAPAAATSCSSRHFRRAGRSFSMVRSRRRWCSSAPSPTRRCPMSTSRERSPSRRCIRRPARSPSARRTTERARELAKRGAVAVLNVIEQAGNMHVRDFSNCGVPCFNLGTDDGRFLKAVLERADAAGAARSCASRSRLETEMRPGPARATTRSASSRAGGHDEIVIVNAHADGWFDAAGDNGDGLAVLVALARHFAKRATARADAAVRGQRRPSRRRHERARQSRDNESASS